MIRQEDRLGGMIRELLDFDRPYEIRCSMINAQTDVVHSGEVNPAFSAIQRWSGNKTAKCNRGEQKRPMPLKGGIGDGSASSSCRFLLTFAEDLLHFRVQWLGQPWGERRGA